MRSYTRIYAAVLTIVMVGCISLLILSVMVGDSPQVITSDGKAYYSWARSVVIDGDIDFSNDYALAYPPDPLPPEAAHITPAGNVVNKYPVGLAILETPGLLAGHLIAMSCPSIATNGLSLPYQLGVVFSLLLFAAMGLFFLHRTMIILGSRPVEATIFATAAVACTNLIHYLAKEPAMPHAAGMAIVCLLLYEIVRCTKQPKDLSIWQAGSWGALLGLLLLVRNSNIFVVPVVGALLWRRNLLHAKTVLAGGIGLVIVSLIQPASLYALWGEFHLTTYPNETLSSNWGGIYRTLFSHRHGLFVYHPWYAFLLVSAAIGLSIASLRLLAASTLVSFCALVIINGSWSCWWFGDSFGNRSFVETIPILSVVAALVHSQAPTGAKRTGALTLLVVLLFLLNVYIWGGYLLHRYPHDGSHSVYQAYCWPIATRTATE